MEKISDLKEKKNAAERELRDGNKKRNIERGAIQH